MLLVIYTKDLNLYWGPSWSWSYGSWIYNYLAISAYHHYSCEFEPRSWRGALDATLCDKVCQWLAICRWIAPGTPVSSTNKTYLHDITGILLKVALNHHHPPPPPPPPPPPLTTSKKSGPINIGVVLICIPSTINNNIWNIGILCYW